MRLILGDWSNDGHGKHEDIILISNYPIEQIQEAYKKSCKLTGISFNHNDDYTEAGRGWEEQEKYRIACKYEDSSLTKFQINILKQFGNLDELLNNTKIFEDYPYDNGDYNLTPDNFAALWLWFVKLSLPDLITKIDNPLPAINGEWNKDLNVQFGYGLFY